LLEGVEAIKAVIAALLAGALASGLCRPDLWRKALVGGMVFLAQYAVFLLDLKLLWPGYIEAVGNLVDSDKLADFRTAAGGGAFRSWLRHVLEQRLRARHWRQRNALRVRAITAIGKDAR
jgi:hypothetical protein